MIDIEKNLNEHDVKIPAINKPIANYSPFTLSNNLIFISGQIPIQDGKIIYQGKVGKHLNIEKAQNAARLCMLNSFGVLKYALQGNLILIKKCIKITVFINSYDLFIDQPRVADGASNLIRNIMNPYSDHARSAVSVNSLPKNSAVEIDSIFEIALEG